MAFQAIFGAVMKAMSAAAASGAAGAAGGTTGNLAKGVISAVGSGGGGKEQLPQPDPNIMAEGLQSEQQAMRQVQATQARNRQRGRP